MQTGAALAVSGKAWYHKPRFLTENGREGERALDALEQRVLTAKQNEQALNDLIRDEKQWILRSASQTARRYVTDRDDEWSVALKAFHEAVRVFEPGKGSFRAIASVVIRRRLTDWQRAEARQGGVVYVTQEAFGGELEDGADGVDLQVRRRVAADAVTAAEDDPASKAREEIAAAQELLGWYGFSLFDLADCSPRAEKTKKSCALAVRALLRDPVLMERMRKTHTLPLKELSDVSGVQRKVLDRHRKYLIAAAEILDGDAFPTLSAYMSFLRKGGSE